jgi:hypothetical protein
MSSDSDLNTDFLKQLASSYVASTFEKIDTCLEILGRNPEATVNHRERVNIFLALLNFVLTLPFEVPELKLFLVESLPELKESYALFPIELKGLTVKVITQIEKIIEN